MPVQETSAMLIVAIATTHIESDAQFPVPALGAEPAFEDTCKGILPR
ncbi:MAG: hypothetical protein ACKVU2_08185 [Saprospiraceae bacterium]